MRLAAISIPKGYLSYIFGKDHEQISINLGGRNIYTFGDEGSILAKPNEYYLDDIFNNNISLLSCLVGENGGGKTTILRLILNDNNCKFILEDHAGKYELTSSLERFHRVYYTPYLHPSIFDSVGNNGKELSKIALMKLDNHGDGGLLDDFLDAHYSENSKRWIKFNNFYRKNQLSKIRLPVFHQVELSLNHFECNIHNSDKFHNTSSQLRPAIRLLLQKIETEAKQSEIEHFLSKGDVHDPNDTS